MPKLINISGLRAATIPFRPSLHNRDGMSTLSKSEEAGPDIVDGPRRPTSAAVAVREFLDEMVEYAGGNELAWKRITHSYNAMRLDRCWPPISDQILSQFLLAMGCTRRRARIRNLGRFVVFTLPPAIDDEELADAS